MKRLFGYERCYTTNSGETYMDKKGNMSFQMDSYFIPGRLCGGEDAKEVKFCVEVDYPEQSVEKEFDLESTTASTGT